MVQRAGRTLRRLRVTRMGVFVGEVAGPQQLTKLGVPVAELVEENRRVRREASAAGGDPHTTHAHHVA